MDKDLNISKAAPELPQRVRNLPQKVIAENNPTTLNEPLREKYVLGEGKLFMDDKEIGHVVSALREDLEPDGLYGRVVEPATNENARDIDIPKTVTIDQMADWMQDMYVMLGAIINKFGSRSVEITPRELEKFKKTKAVRFTASKGGICRYTIDKLPKGKQLS